MTGLRMAAAGLLPTSSAISANACTVFSLKRSIQKSMQD
jgi:hypothetical protein